jgi:hypothetical protein
MHLTLIHGLMQRCVGGKTRLRPRPALTPVSFYKDIPPVSMDPTVCDQAGVRPRRLDPSASGPNVSASVPAVIPRSPDVALPRRRASDLDDGARWTEPDNYLLCVCGANGKKQAKRG